MRERKLVVGLVTALALIALFGLRGADLRSRRAQILRAGDRRAENLALILAGYVRQNFGAGDAALRQLALLSQRIGGPNAPDDEWLPVLQGARVGLAAVGAISVVDWDHRLPSATLILRVYGYYSEDTLEAGHEAFDDRLGALIDALERAVHGA